MVKPSKRKLMARNTVVDYGLSVRRSCELFCISRTTYNYVGKLANDNEHIKQVLLKLTNEHRTWGFQLCYLHMRNVLGLKFNHKRVYRIYCELCLNLRIKPKRRVTREKPEKLALAQFQIISGLWTLCMIICVMAESIAR